MNIAYRTRDFRITSSVIEELNIKFKLVKKGDISLDELGSTNNFDDKFDIPEDNENCDSIYKDILDIGRELNELLSKIDLSKNNIDEPLIELFYRNNIKLIIKNNIDIFEKNIIGFIDKYGAFMTISTKLNYSKLKFSVIDFLFEVYILYEIHVLYSSFLYDKPIKLALFNSIYDYKISKSFYNNDKEIEKYYEDKENICDIIDSRINLIDKKINDVRLVTLRDDDEKFRWKTILLFPNPIAVALYKLKLEISDNSETSLSICKNPYCNNVFQRYSARQKYCLEDECNLSRQRQRKHKSLSSQKK